MACLHDHSCEDQDCSSDWSLYKRIDLTKASALNEATPGSVKSVFSKLENTACSWLRNIFHDCAVQSCDVSLLLTSTKRSLSEQEHDRSFGLRNFRYFDIIKEAVERECPGVVSSSDILVLSARDGVCLARRSLYSIENWKKRWQKD